MDQWNLFYRKKNKYLPDHKVDLSESGTNETLSLPDHRVDLSSLACTGSLQDRNKFRALNHYVLKMSCCYFFDQTLSCCYFDQTMSWPASFLGCFKSLCCEDVLLFFWSTTTKDLHPFLVAHSSQRSPCQPSRHEQTPGVGQWPRPPAFL